MKNPRTIRIKHANGTVYLYEDVSYRDKERGYSTHKRKCIGKVGPDGSPIYNQYYLMREKMKSISDEASNPAKVSQTTLVGQTMVLDREVNKAGLRKPLDVAFGNEDASRILALAYYFICRGKALSRSEQWLEDRGFGSLNLSTQRISELLQRLDDDKVNTFFALWLNRNKSRGRNFLFDITSVSTYGKDNAFAEYGYNRDRESLEQINLALLSSCDTGLPLWYDILPGSMSDKVVLNATLKKLKKLDSGSFSFCGDRGFYSESNLKMLSENNISFTIPVPSSIKWGRELIAKHRASLIHPDHLIDEGKTKLYGKTVYNVTEHGRTWYHIFFDPARKDMVQAEFMLKLQRCKDELERNEPLEVHENLYKEYFIVTETPKRGRKVTYNDEALQAYLESDSCYWILMSTAEKNAAKALASYRDRGNVELSFDDMKNLLDMNRLRNHNEHTVKGKVFVNFIALAILSSLRKSVDEIPPKDRLYMSESEMLDRVETYMRVHFMGKYKDVYSTPTRMQRKVFDLLGIPYDCKADTQNMASVLPLER